MSAVTLMNAVTLTTCINYGVSNPTPGLNKSNMTSPSECCSVRHYFYFRVLVYLVYCIFSDRVLHHCNVQA